MIIPIPVATMTFVDWRDSLQQLRPDFQINPRIDNDHQWRPWVDRFLQNPQCQTLGIPRHDGYEEWWQWAQGLIKALGNSA